MGHGTIQAKLEPLIQIKKIDKIYFLRKERGPSIDSKVEYINLPAICKFSLFNILLTPFLLAYYTIRHKADLIIGYHVIPYAFFAFISSSLTGRPFIVCQTGSLIQRKSNNKFFFKIFKYVINKSQKFCVPGKNAQKFWSSKSINEKKLLILHSSVDTNKFIPLNQQSDNYCFIYSGRLSQEKRIDLIIRSFSKLIKDYPHTKLLILGDGPLMHNLVILTVQLGLTQNIEFIGFKPDVRAYLARAKWFVMASETEGLPCALMEAMSMGLIPISSNVGNISDVITEGETGFLFQKNDEMELEKILRKVLILNPIRVEDISKKASQIIKDTQSHESSILKWENILSYSSK